MKATKQALIFIAKTKTSSCFILCLFPNLFNSTANQRNYFVELGIFVAPRKKQPRTCRKLKQQSFRETTTSKAATQSIKHKHKHTYAPSRVIKSAKYGWCVKRAQRKSE